MGHTAAVAPAKIRKALASPRLIAAEPLIAALLYILVISIAVPWWSIYAFDSDEGVNLMKAALLDEGYRLYVEIWSDQPPVLTYLLAPIHALFPASVSAPRLLILFFAGLTIFSLFRILGRAEGRIAAWIGVIVLAGSQTFAETSTRVMIGLPAIAIGLAAMDQALAGAKSGKRWRFIVAGVLFALALQTKMFVGTITPALLLTPLCGRWQLMSQRRQAISDIAILAGTVVGCFLIIVLLVGLDPSQILSPHVTAGDVPSFQRIGGFDRVLASFQPEYFLFIAALGVGAFLRHRRLEQALPILWLAVAGIVLINHRPFWDHHAALLQVPLAWLCGLAAGLFRPGWAWRPATAALAVVVVVVSAAGLKTVHQRNVWRVEENLDSPLVARNPGAGEWVVVDRLMDAYRANALVPPALAVYTSKRVQTGNLSQEQVADIIAEYQPTEILFRRFRPSEPMLEALATSYEPFANGRGYHHAFLRDAPTPTAPGRARLLEALSVAADDLLQSSVSGGYAGHTDLETGERYGRSPDFEGMRPDEILIRSPGGTEDVGQCFRQAYRLSGKQKFDEAAMSAARALACAQGTEGGWANIETLHASCLANPPDHPSEPISRPLTMDEGTTPSVISYLIDVRQDILDRKRRPPRWLDASIQRGLAGIIKAQHRRGGWPQYFPANEGYSRLLTLNDNATPSAITVLLKGYAAYGTRSYLKAAKKGGRFLLKAQGPDGQAGWAQQYDPATLQPEGARTFEPAAYASRETGYAMNALLDLYRVTGDDRFVDPVERARDWLEGSMIGPDTWSRLYEIGTNRPIYGDRDGSVHYDLAEISEERRDGYDWQMSFPAVLLAIQRDDIRRREGRKSLVSWDDGIHRYEPLSPEEWAAAELLATDSTGESWRLNGTWLSTPIFVENCQLIVRAIAAGRSP